MWQALDTYIIIVHRYYPFTLKFRLRNVKANIVDKY